MEADLITVDKNYDCEIFRNIKRLTRVTDFACLLGCLKWDGAIVEGNFWVKQKDLNKSLIVNHLGKLEKCDYTDRTVGIRPVLPLSIIENASYLNSYQRTDGILEVEYGYYPQDVSPINEQLELIYKNNKKELFSTKNSYTIDLRKKHQNNEKFLPMFLPEYEYDGKKYVRIICSSSFYDERLECKSLKRKIYSPGQHIWVEVKPVKWLVDEKEKLMISKKILIAGVPYHFEDKKTTAFDETTMNSFLNEYFVKDITQFYQKGYSDNINKILTNYSYFIEKLKQMTTEEKREFLEPFLVLTEENRKIIGNFFKIVDDELFELYDRQEKTPKTKKKKRFFR